MNDITQQRPTRRQAIVTGAAGAIGGAVAHRLVAEGFDVVGLDVREPEAPTFRSAVVDLTDAGATAAAVHDLLAAAPVPVLVNVAGWTSVSRFVEEDEAYWRRLVEINFLATVRLCHLLVPAMCDAGWGRIVNIGSAAGQTGAARTAVYAGTKGAVHAFTKSLAQEVSPFGVTVNAVAPGVIDTPLSSQDPAYTSRLARNIPRRRLGTPADIAAMVAFLCDGDADYVTGQVLGVNGGLTMMG
jgi:2-hydroxycyclohexanecarboxyl-CoA dehydrogenase